jgi:hypothetical protein
MEYMRKNRKLGAVTFVLSSACLALSAHAEFGAIAYSVETGSYGIATGYTYREAAELDAHDTCYGNGAPDCNVVVWWRDACGALALSDNGVYGSAWSDTIDAAHRAAISYCVFEGGEACYLEASNC